MELPVLDAFSQLRSNYGAVKDLRAIYEGASKSLLNVVCLVLGPSGSGKSALENIVRANGPCEVFVVTERLPNIESALRNFVDHRTIHEILLSGGKPSRKVVFLDDIDAILAIEKNICALIQKYKARVGFLCTASLSEERKLSNLKKIATHVIRLSRMSAVDCFLRVQELMPDLPMEDDELLGLVKRHESNLSVLKPYIDAHVETRRTASAKSDVSLMFNVNIYDQAERLMRERVEPETVSAVVQKDACLVSLLLHENVVNATASRSRPSDTRAFLAMYDAICDTDLYERALFGKSVPTSDAMDFRKLCIMNAHFAALPKTTAKTKFTQYFTKLSLQTTMRKRLEELCPGTGGFDRLTILTACHKACGDAATNSIVEDRTALDLIKRFQKDFGS